jgi:fimbrial isopeptide formation D2 family protein/LPXTG-motif cell wall-anchored protein
MRLLGAFVSASLAIGGVLAPAMTLAPAWAETSLNESSVEGGASAPFYIFLKAGEYLYVDSDQVISPVLDESGDAVSDIGDGMTYGPATVDGVWQVNIGSMTGEPAPTGWTIEARESDMTTPVIGRVWSELYQTTQFNGSGDDFRFWVVNDMGYVYDVTFQEYNGIYSRIRADAVGNTAEADDCLPLYSSQESRLDETGGWNSVPDCGGTYRIFFDEPADDLPARGLIGGEEQWIKPAPMETDDLPVAGPDFSRSDSSSTAQAGEFTWELDSRFTGSHWLEIDVNNDGYDFSEGSPDRRILVYADGSGSYEYDFDGLDALGEPMSVCSVANARLFFDKVGEVHFVQDDVEGRVGGVSVTRTNGPNSPDSTIYWDDTGLSEDVANSTPVLDGTAGVDSSGGVHGWDFDWNSWGNDRVIEDWTYALVDYATEDVALPASNCLSIDKTSDAEDQTRVNGDTVTYEVTVQNPGEIDFTEANPASFSDDLSDVLDDADFNDDVEIAFSEGTTGAVPELAGSSLSWSGPLKAGETATITYSVTLKPGGDRTVLNTACLTAEATVVGDRCAETQTRMPSLQIEKSADRSTLPSVESQITYTVIVTNPGPGDYTEASPATATDDLSAVLDDATFDESSLTASVGDVEFSGTSWQWEGPLEAGESAVIRYSVTYTAEGNHVLENTACVPEDQVAAGSTACDDVVVPGSSLTFSKESTPSADPLQTGDYVDYTLWFDNAGEAAATVDHTDYIGYVLDDAEIVDGPEAGVGDLTASLSGDKISVAGQVPAGERYSITYRVQIKPTSERGDDLLVNHLLEGDPQDPPSPPDSEDPCVDTTTSTCNPVAAVRYSKSVQSDTDPVGPGSVLTYTVTIESIGQTTVPVSREDVLDDVLDDATMTAQPSSDTDSVSVSAVADNRFAMTGELEAGKTATITYDVTVNPTAERGNNSADNFLVPVGEDPPAACEADSDDCTVTPLPLIEAAKSVDPESGATVIAGQTLTYTLTFTNAGEAEGAVDYTDDLAALVDDATVIGEVSTSDAALTAEQEAADRIRVTGTLAAGQTVTVTYQVTVNSDGERGDDVVDNFLVPTGQTPPQECVSTNALCTTNPVPRVVSSKSVDPVSGTPVVAGQELTYTLTFTNEGKGTGSVDRVDDLSHVLDDARLVSEPVASSSALTVTRSANRLRVVGSLESGQTFTVSYTVKVRASENRGDDVLANFLIDPDSPTPSEPTCEQGSTDCTSNPVGEIQASKTVDPESGSKVRSGDTLTYILSFTNTGKRSADVDYVDHLVDVLDDASLFGEVEASDGLTVTGPKKGAIRITGSVEAGATATVIYTVKVRSYGAQGNHDLDNYLTPAGGEPAEACVSQDPLCTTNPVLPPDGDLPSTGSNGLFLGAGVGVLALLGGGAMLLASRRRRGTV